MSEIYITATAATALALSAVAYVLMSIRWQRSGATLAAFALAGLSFVVVTFGQRLRSLNTGIAEKAATIQSLQAIASAKEAQRATADAALAAAYDVMRDRLTTNRLSAPLRDRTADTVSTVTAALRMTPSSPPAMSQLRTVAELLRRAKTQPVPGAVYKVSTARDAELVADRVGTYYVVSLIGSATGRPLTFTKGEYSLEETPELAATFQRLRTELIEPLAAAFDVELFVVGGADAEHLEEPWRGSAPTAVPVLRRRTDGKYAVFPDRPHHTLGPKLRNEDLPILRAQFLAQRAAQALEIAEPKILHNSPAREYGTEFRTADFILFIGW